jgi:hypothetical protein
MYQPKHYTAVDFIPRAIYEKMGQDALMLMHDEVLITMDDIWDHFYPKAITVNNYASGGQWEFRGFRPAYCIVGVAPHRMGYACDFDVEGMTADDARHEIIANRDKFKYITRMEMGVNWVHIDRLVTNVSNIVLFHA